MGLQQVRYVYAHDPSGGVLVTEEPSERLPFKVGDRFLDALFSQWVEVEDIRQDGVNVVDVIDG